MYDDQPPFGADEKCKAAHFGRHPLGRSVLGTVQSITDLPVERHAAILRIAATAPATSSLVAAGPRSTSRRWWKRPSASAAPGPASSASRDMPPAAAAPGLSSACTRKSPRSNMCCNWPPGPAAADDDRYAAKMLATIARRRLRQPALLGPGRQRAGRTGLAGAPRLSRRRVVHDVHVLRGRAGCKTISSASPKSTPTPSATASPTPSCCKPRAKSTPASCSPASARGAGCSRVGGNWIQRARISHRATRPGRHRRGDLDDLAARAEPAIRCRSTTTLAIGPAAAPARAALIAAGRASTPVALASRRCVRRRDSAMHQPQIGLRLHGRWPTIRPITIH